jgi:hypothetical protein
MYYLLAISLLAAPTRTTESNTEVFAELFSGLKLFCTQVTQRTSTLHLDFTSANVSKTPNNKH